MGLSELALTDLSGRWPSTRKRSRPATPESRPTWWPGRIATRSSAEILTLVGIVDGLNGFRLRNDPGQRASACKVAGA